MTNRAPQTSRLLSPPRSPGAYSELARHLAIAYAALIAYACLHPLSGWHNSGLPPFDYLSAPWPKYYRVEDLVHNVLGYIPLGFVLVPGLRAPPSGRWRAARQVWRITLYAALLSLCLETIQNYLPARVSSNVDLGCNALGGLLGALLGLAWGHRLFDSGGVLERWRHARIAPGRSGDAGLILIGLWLLTQLQPNALLFSSGDLRTLLALPTPMAFAPERFMRFESALVAVGALAIGLFTHSILRTPRVVPLLLVLCAGIVAKSLATSAFFVTGSPLNWLTPGSRVGLLLGLPLLAGALLLPRIHQHALAGVSLLVATTLTNLMPDNPYLQADQQAFVQGNFLSFHGLTQVVAGAWPFIALAYLSAIGLWRGDHLKE